MKVLRRDFLMFENFGMLRHLARYIRQDAGVLEVDLYDIVSRTARAEPERWPAVEFVVTSGAEVMAPPVSWRLFVDEVHRMVVDQLGVADDDRARHRPGGPARTAASAGPDLPGPPRARP